MTVLPSYVLKRVYDFWRFTGYDQYDFVSSIFASYYKTRGSKSTYHAIMTYPLAIPMQMIWHYSDPQDIRCPPKLCADIEYMLSLYKLMPSQKIELYMLLQEIRDEIPADDRIRIQVGNIDELPTHKQLAYILTQILWYSICTERALAALGKLA